MNFKIISRYVGNALLVNAFFMMLALVVSIVDGFDDGFAPLCISSLITAIIGFFPFIFVRKSKEMRTRDGYMIIILSWVLSFIFGMLPYILYGREFTLVNAWFESVSGYTTTGASILTDIEALPRSILFWRSSTQYIGGLGAAVFLLLVIPESGPFRQRLSTLEISSMSRYGYKYKSGTTAKVILSVYVGLTAVETLLLWAAGMNAFDAVNHSFCTVSTGGFSTRNLSVMAYDSTLIEIILILFMILSSIHFGVIFAVFAKRSLRPLTGSVTKYYLAVISVLTLLVASSLIRTGTNGSWHSALLDSGFQVVSYVSTTGFRLADNVAWPFIANLFLLFAAFHGGCSGSTTGGIKADRMFVAFKEIHNEFLRRLHPSSMFRTRVDGGAVRKEELSSVFLYIVVYIFVLMASFILLLMTGTEVGDAFSGALSSLSNVGPGIGSIGTMGSYASVSPMAKFILTIDMFVGRLEIYPLLILASMAFKINER